MSGRGHWEHGSEFHWQPIDLGMPEAVPWEDGLLLSCGRDALLLLLAHGYRERGWRRLWLPDYFSQGVVAALTRSEVELLAFPDNPLLPMPAPPAATPGDAVLVMNYFGIRAPGSLELREGVDVIEDHSHDPTSEWARSSSADFCMASFRKALPLPDGGALWSPRRHSLPLAPPETAQRRLASADRVAAMLLKAMYLDGQPIDPASYRLLEQESEQEFGVGVPSSMTQFARTVLSAFPFEGWRRARMDNWEALRARLADVEWISLLAPTAPNQAPFSALLVFDSAERRDRVRRELIGVRVYPAVLWSLEEPVLTAGRDVLELSRRVLSIPCDGRYGREDMERVGSLIEAAGSA